jgi:branched-chain amino acid transport system ATP-binding protein
MSVLVLDNVSKSFGGLQATNKVSLTVDEGELVSIIGPNGAGKTTLFNQISGYILPDSGTIQFQGINITGAPPHELVHVGIGRAFQRSNIFARLTTYENIQAAVISANTHELNFWQQRLRRAHVDQRTHEILRIIQLDDKRAGRKAGTLALGDQKRLEIGLALALNPKLLLLDEPTAGMSPQETEDTVALINDITRQFNMSLLFTEHDMDVVFNISQRIYVLAMGQVIAEGAPQAIADNPRVQQVYLGTEAELEF